MAKITHEPLKLEYGYFYWLYIAPANPPFIEFGEDETWINGEENNPRVKRIRGEIVRKIRKEVVVRDCSISKAHRLSHIYCDFEVDLNDNTLTSDFLPTSDTFCIVSNDLRGRIENSGLQGAKFHAVKRTTVQGEDFDVPAPYFSVEFTGNSPFLNPRVVPSTENSCPFCGLTPLYCPECWLGESDCRRCGKRVYVRREKHEGGEDKRFIYIHSSKDSIIGLELWDGSDFLHDGVVTRRTIDFFSSIHAAPFKAEPLPVNVHGLSDKNRERLETARDMTKLNW